MKIDRTSPPKEKGIIDFRLPEIQKFDLKNGLKILFVQKDNLPIVQINLTLGCGGIYNPSDKIGLAYLTSMMIDEGAGEFDALQLDEEFETLGSILGTSSDHDSIHISLLSLRENFERSMELVSKIITEPRFSTPDFEREKEKLLTRIIQLKDEPSYLASKNFEKIIFSGSPYSNQVIGTDETLNNITIEDIKKFHKENFTVNNSVMVVVGDINREKLEETLNNSLAVWVNSNPQTEQSFDLKINNPTLYFIHKDGAAQSEIRAGHSAAGRKEKDFFARSLLNAILGGQFSSRINLNLREDKGYTYGANSSFKFYKSAALFGVSTAVKSENTGDAVFEIIKELNEIQNGVDDKEIDFAKSFIIKGFPSMFETYSQVARNLALLSLHSLPDDYFNTYIQRIDSTSKNEIENAAVKSILCDNLTIVVVGDRDIIKPQLESVWKNEIIEIDKEGNKV